MTEVVGLNTEDLMKDFDKTLVAGSTRGVMRDIGAKSRDLWQVDIKNLRIMDGFNVRVRNKSFHAHVAQLASSMKTEGFYQQHALAGFVAKEGDEQVIYITDGHCRLEAIHLANSEGAEINTVPVVISSTGTSVEDLTVGLVRGNSGKQLDPFELAVVAKRLHKWNWTQKDIAHRMGVSVTTVQNYLTLMQAPREIRDMVADGVVGMHTALEALRTRGAEAVGDLQRAADGSAKAANGARKSVERRDVVAPSFGSSIKKAAPRMFAAINDLRSDSGYQSLTDETRTKIDALVAELEDLRGKAAAAIGATAKQNGETGEQAGAAKTEGVEAEEQVAA